MDIIKEAIIYLYKNYNPNYTVDKLLSDYPDVTIEDLLANKYFCYLFTYNEETKKILLNNSIYLIKIKFVNKHKLLFIDLATNEAIIKNTLSDFNYIIDNDLIIFDLHKNRFIDLFLRQTNKISCLAKISKKNILKIIPPEVFKDYIFILHDQKNIKNNTYFEAKIKKVTNQKIYLEHLNNVCDKNDNFKDTYLLISNSDFNLEFNYETLKEAKSLKLNENDFKNRLDYTNKLTFTIDGDDTKDFDDAISFEKINDNKYIVGVHIADVSNYVKENSKIDQEAYERGTSVYLGNITLPMLPFELSNDLCSLNPNTNKLCLSVIYELDNNFKILNYDIKETIINSNYKLTYNQVNDFLINNISLNNIELEVALTFLNNLSKKIITEKEEIGLINFSSDEIKFIFDENNNVINLKLREQKDSEKLIESLMVLTNETIATHLTNLDYPSVYRVHDKPTKEDFFILQENLKKIGYNFNKLAEPNIKNIDRILMNFKDSKYENIVSSMVLKIMPKAYYDNFNIGHFGLNSLCYTHFTSPIRRYPDLILHRLIKDLLFNPNINILEKINHYEQILPRILKNNSLQERKAISLERDNAKLLMINYLENNKNEIYKGQIVHMLETGFFVKTEEGLEGFVTYQSMNEYYTYDENTLTAYGDLGTKYKIGDYVKVYYKDSNKEKLLIDFKLYERRKKNYYQK